MGIKYVATDDPAHADLSTFFLHGFDQAMPVLDLLGLDRVHFGWAEHVVSRADFWLISEPDGPILAVCPITSLALDLLFACVPDAVPLHASAAADWANGQRWTMRAWVLAVHCEDGCWRSIGPDGQVEQ